MVEKSARVPRLVAGVDLTELPLSPLEGFVLSRIDGAADLATLGSAAADVEHIEGGRLCAREVALLETHAQLATAAVQMLPRRQAACAAFGGLQTQCMCSCSVEV